MTDRRNAGALRDLVDLNTKPWATLYGFSLSLMMTAVYYEAPLVALQGVALLIGTILYFSGDSA